MSAPTSALFFTNAMFVLKLFPFDSSTMRLSKNGVTLRPWILRFLASRIARVVHRSISAPVAFSYCSGTGTANNIPLFNRIAFRASIMFAASSAESTVVDGLNPESRVKKAGNAVVLYPTVVTPNVSKTYNVFPISKIDFTPAQTTTVCFARASSVRSLEMSNVDSASR